MAKTAQGIGKTIFGIATNVLKIGAAGLGVGAILGGFGFDSLANAAFSRSSQAGSLGISPGELASFKVNLQPFLGAGDLQNAVAAQTDITKAPALRALGITDEQTVSPADLAIEELRKATAIYQRTPKNLRANNPALMLYQSMLGGDLANVRNVISQGGIPALNADQAAYHRDAGPLGFDKQTAAEWTKLKKTLDEAGMTIETALIKSLAPLAPEIAEASKSVAGFISTFLNSKDFGTIIDDVRDGMKDLGQFVETTDWKGIGADVKQLSDELVNALRFLHLIPQPGGGDKQPGPLLGGKSAFENTQGAKAVKGAWAWLSGAFGKAGNAIGNAGHAIEFEGIKDLWTEVGGDPKVAAKMAAIADAESGFNPNATNKNKDGSTDYGLFQINSVHAAELAKAGLKNWKTDPTENAKAALLVSGAGRNNLTPWVTWNEYAGGKDTAAAHKIAADLNAPSASEKVKRLLQEAMRSARRAPGHGESAHVAAGGHRTTKPARTKPLATRPIHIAIANATQARVAVSMNAIAGI
jgi:Lysozyme like domain